MAAGAVLFFYLGALFTSRQKKFKTSKRNFFAGILLLFASFVFAFVLFRYLRAFLSVPLGSGISLKSAFFYVLIAVAPLNFMQGAVSFSVIDLFKKNNVRISIAVQVLGFVIGTIAASLFFTGAFGTDIIFITAALFLVLPFLLSRTRKEVYCLAGAAVFMGLVISGLSYWFDKQIFSIGFPGREVIEYKYTPYGQTILLSKDGETALLENGVVGYSNPDNSIIDSEDFGHIPALYSADPKRVLIIGGAAKYLPMVLAHKVEQVDYVEPDKAVTDILSANIYNTDRMFADAKVNIYTGNVRRFMDKSVASYDLILIGFPDPVNLYINSFYTKDFFLKAKKTLTPGGVLAINVSGKLTYASYIMAELSKSVMEAMEESFKYVNIIPGNLNIIIGSDAELPYRMDIKKRLYDVQSRTLVLSKYYLDDLMDTQTTLWLENEMDMAPRGNIANTDFSPRAMMLSVLYVQSGFSPYLSVFVDEILRHSYLIVFAVIIIFFLSKSLYKTSAFVGGVGVSWFAFNAVFALQTYSGQILKWGLPAAAVLFLGIASGILAATKILKSIPLSKKIFFCEAAFLALFAAWYIILMFYAVSVFSVFPAILIAGILAGMNFEFLREHFHTAAEKKRMMFLTIAGAWAAAILGGGFLIPAWGIMWSLYFVFFLKFLIFARWADIKNVLKH